MKEIFGISPYYRGKLALLILFSMAIRAFLAAWLELGNDEVYYYTYALFPDWSHFDHPPMVGWMMQLFSLNLHFDSELALRMSSVVLMSANTLLIFLAGKALQGERTGWYAALFYTSSVYAFVITGFMILPDTPQNFFWMLSLLLMLWAVKKDRNKQPKLLLLLIGLAIGLGMISKYTSVFLWVGFGLYILFHRREWLKLPMLWIAVLLSALCLIPVIYWNVQNEFISFSFQGERVNILEGGLRPSLFFTELGGQFLYNNPFVFVFIWLAVMAVMRNKQRMRHEPNRLLLWLGMPLIVLFLFFSLFRPTLPHWTGPAYNTLLLLAAARLSSAKRLLFPWQAVAALSLLLVIITLGSLQVKYGLIPVRDQQPYHLLGKNDVTLDMYGWRALKPAFETIRNQKIAEGLMEADDALVGENWFPLANLDYYVGRPLHMKTMGIGKPERLHKYLWINHIRGGFHYGDDFWYLTSSRDYKHPSELYEAQFEQIVAADTVEILRNGSPAKRYFVFLLKDLKTLPADGLQAVP